MSYYDDKWHSWHHPDAPHILNKADTVSVLYKNGYTNTTSVKRTNWENVVAFLVVERARTTINIGDMVVPSPVREELKRGDSYWIPHTTSHDALYASNWEGAPMEIRWLRRGLIHRTREAAFAHARALIKISGGSVDE